MQLIRGAGRWAACALLFVASLLPGLAIAQAPALANDGCLACHEAKAHKIDQTGADGKSHALGAVEAQKFAAGVHARMACVACHTGIKDNPAPGSIHQKDPARAGPSSAGCTDCHAALNDPARPRLAAVNRNAEAYKTSFHARPSKADKSKPNATCEGCHDSHGFAVPANTSPEYATWRLDSSALCGKSCHSDELDDYTASIHGQEALKKRNVKAAVCVDCHSSHAIGNTSADPVKLAITASCGSCHEKNYQSYKATYHGQISTLGYAYTAKCFDCHGSHTILEAKNPDSKVHPDNRMDTCKNCHGKKGVGPASAGFATYQPHARTDDFARYPQVWLGYQMMVGLLLGTFGFFWLHTAMWFWREWQDRRNGVTQKRIAETVLPVELRGKHFKRFGAIWRLAHISFALSLMILTLTGMPLFYPDAAWAPMVMQALGGPKVAAVIHRVNAVIFAAVFFAHLVYIVMRLWKKRATFRWFGPDSLIPNWQDARDMLAMFKWFVGRGPRPVFDHWTYWEKFDYWAPFWGVTIIGVSGLMMWLPHLTGSYLPGWVFNVAAIFHGEEAFLAVVFLFTVHFFNNHFRPDKFPVEVVMFTGTMSLEHYAREHAVEYRRLLASGELEKHLVDAPSAPMTLASKLLGFVLIAVGLTLLAGVAIGFFGGH